jgi:hypothetical protein
MAWRANQEVVCTELEEGAVLLNMESRLYYGLDPVGLEVFNLAQSVEDRDALGRELEARFEVDTERARRTAARFVAQLEQEGLLVSADGVEPQPETPAPDGSKRPFSEPELIRHDEPLHDVAISPFDPQLPLAE